MRTKRNIDEILRPPFNLDHPIGSFSNYLFDNYDDVKNFCQVFSNIEHLGCTTEEPDYFLFALNHLSE
jgi:hypothetical protein